MFPRIPLVGLILCILHGVSLAQSPLFGIYNLNAPGPGGPAGVVAADFNRDGKMDFAVATQSGSQPNLVLVYLGNGDGTFQQPVSYTTGSFVFTLISSDFNGDGTPDLATGNAQSQDVSVLLGVGDGTFQAAVSYPAGGAPGGLVAVDLNGDGKVDIAVADQRPAQVTILLGNGDGTFQAGAAQALGTALTGIAAADFDGDRKADLAVADTHSTVWLLAGRGDGTFEAPRSIAVEGTPEGIASADFNADGIADIAVTNVEFTGGVSVLIGMGGGAFKPPQAFPAGSGTFAVAVGDFNADGKPDLAVANNFAVPLHENVSLLFGNGDGSFAAAMQLGAGNNAFSLVAGDLNGDGKLDLAVANNGSNYVSLLLNGPPAGLASFTTVSAASVNAGLAPESLVTAYGIGVSGFQIAPGLPLPTSVAGLSVEVLDSAGRVRLAPLLYLSLGQINFQIPAGTALGPATLTIANGTAAAMREPVQISRVAPGIFTANADGEGVPSAQVLRVDGANQTYELTFQPGPGGTLAPRTIDLSNGSVYLLLYGTGIRGGSGAAVTATLGGNDVPVLFAGDQGGYLGLDQVNIGPLPKSLAGRGTVNLVLKVEDKEANTVTLAF